MIQKWQLLGEKIHSTETIIMFFKQQFKIYKELHYSLRKLENGFPSGHKIVRHPEC